MDAEPNADRPAVWGAALAILIAGALAYGRSFSVPFLFDDRPAILANPTLRDLGSWTRVLSPPQGGIGVEGRPIVNLSLALNYAVGGLNPWGYHAVNLAIHLMAGLLLFGIVRRTAGRTGLAAVVALLWTIHPLLTESVTCVIQRTESMMGMFYLATLYCFIRSAESYRSETLTRSGAMWAVLSITACLCGMATKEVMVTAPLIVLLYDRTFISGTFTAAWNRRRTYYLALAATWLLLAYLVIGEGGSRDASAGFGHGVTPWTYALTQCWGIVRYLRLAFWPSPLILDYGKGVITRVGEVAPQGLLLLALLAATLGFLFRAPDRRRWIGFLGAWFFLILAPSSSFLPLVSQTVAEHRMYLPLAAIVTGVVLAVDALGGPRGLILCAGCGVVLGGLTLRRNADYRSEIAIWADTVAKRPTNPRAEDSLASAYLAAGRWSEAIVHDQAALRLQPDFVDARSNLGDALLRGGRRAEAIAAYREALAIDPKMPRCWTIWAARSPTGETPRPPSPCCATPWPSSPGLRLPSIISATPCAARAERTRPSPTTGGRWNSIRILPRARTTWRSCSAPPAGSGRRCRICGPPSASIRATRRRGKTFAAP